MQIDTGAGMATDGPSQDTPRFTRVAIKAFRVTLPLALLAVLAAVALNWWFAPNVGEPLPGPATAVDSRPIPEPEYETLDKAALDLLPSRVLQYETITRQAIPGYGDRGAEAVYRTLNMNLAAQISTVTYARAEAFESEQEAAARLQEIMARYPVGRTTEIVGATQAIVGLSSDKSSYAKGWTDGRYVTLVKTSFDEWTPELHPEIIEAECDRVSTDVELYQRTGKEGVQAR